ncbi:MAG TPA: hypothetical protein VGD45_06190 [Steroidobacter sp.]|uniref:hypothetical protein n=1 Tax=Steroidobacter sp. TaxID=1978227 RepID=UPI002ED92293
MFAFFAALAGMFFFGQGRKYRAAGATFSGIFLILFAIADFYTSMWRSPTGDRAIRADLVLLLPLAVLALVVGLVSLRAASRED